MNEKPPKKFRIYKHLRPLHPQESTQIKLRKGVYVLPSLFTSCCLFFGFYSIITSINATTNEDFRKAALAIVIASFFDAIDGRVARLTHTASRFGMEYDSLSDLVSFGLAPGLLCYCWGLKDLGRIGFIGTFLYFACTALRLARFNTVTESMSKAYFLGLPSPAAAMVIVSTFLLQYEIWPDNRGNHYFFAILVYVIAFLMVSNIHYKSFKEFDLRKKKSFRMLISIVVILAIFSWQPELILFLIVNAYVLFGFIHYALFRKIAKHTNTIDSNDGEFPSQPEKP